MVNQGRLGSVSIGGTVYPVHSWQIQAPRNIVLGTPVGNGGGASNQADGLQSTRISMRMFARVKAAEVLAAAFWDLFLTRTWSSGFDDTPASTLIMGSGRKTRTALLAKAESFVVTVQKGSQVGIDVTFLAPGIPSEANTTLATSYVNMFDGKAPLMFDQCTFGGFATSVYAATISYSNNHQPDGPLDATKYLTSWDAGVPTAGAQLTFKELAASTLPFTEEAELSLAMAGDATRTLFMSSCSANDHRDIGVGLGQLYQPMNVTVKGTPTHPIPIYYS